MCYHCCSPFETVDTTGQFSHAQPSAYTNQTSAPLYANDAIANSGTLYEEISTDHGAATVRVMVRALYDYEAVEDDELSLTAGKTCVCLCVLENAYIHTHIYIESKKRNTILLSEKMGRLNLNLCVCQ